MSIYHIDFETRSRADLKKVGAFRYANDPSTRILCAAIAKDDEEPVVWTCPLLSDFERGRDHYTAMDKLARISADPEALIYAHNAPFEIALSDALWRDTFGTPPPRHDQWRCTMAMARRAALPVSLAKCAEALGLKQQKDGKGAALIRKFSVPQKKTGEFIGPDDDPEAFRQFCEYCAQDVRVEQEIHKRLKPFELAGLHLRSFQLTLDINTRGLPVNLDALAKARVIIEEETGKQAAVFQRLTGLLPTQTKKVLEWLKQKGYPGDNLQAETLDGFLEDGEFDPSTPWGHALLILKRVNFASLKKVPSMLACAGPHDNRVRGTLTDHGAGTGRWTAQLIQPQNMKSPSKHLEALTADIYRDVIAGATAADIALLYGPPLECLSSCIRHFIQWEGEFLDADYSAIEARIIAWQAREEWRLEVFRTHGKIYEASASQMFGTPMAEFDSYKNLHGVAHPHRKKGKVAELALGYQGGVNAMLKMGAEKEGLTKEELGPIVKAWREASPNIVQLWYDAENAAKQAVRNPGTVHEFGIGCAMACRRVSGIDYLFMQLPSRRRIYYPYPRLEKQIRWVSVNKQGEEENRSLLSPTPEQVEKVRKKYPDARMSDALTYWGQIPMKAAWGRISLYGGKCVENMVQGIAADVMAIGADNARAAGYEIVSLIHDEALAHLLPGQTVGDFTSHLLPGQTVEDFISHLTRMPAWADGLPLEAAGDIIPFYKKG